MDCFCGSTSGFAVTKIGYLLLGIAETVSRGIQYSDLSHNGWHLIFPIVQPIHQELPRHSTTRPLAHGRVQCPKCPKLKRCYAARGIYVDFHEAKITTIQACANCLFPRSADSAKECPPRDG